MKRTILVISNILIAFMANAQSTDSTKKNTEIIIDKPTGNGSSSTFVRTTEINPEFPGGLEAFYSFLSSNVRYPKDARRKEVQGRVLITFIIEKDGAITDVKVIRGVFPSIDAEAIRLIQLSPKWHPGMQNGAPVRCAYTVPINFSL